MLIEPPSKKIKTKLMSRTTIGLAVGECFAEPLKKYPLLFVEKHCLGQIPILAAKYCRGDFLAK